MTTSQIVAAGCLAAAAQLLCPPLPSGYYWVWEQFNPDRLDWVRLALQLGATAAVTAAAAAAVGRPAPASASPPAAASPR